MVSPQKMELLKYLDILFPDDCRSKQYFKKCAMMVSDDEALDIAADIAIALDAKPKTLEEANRLLRSPRERLRAAGRGFVDEV